MALAVERHPNAHDLVPLGAPLVGHLTLEASSLLVGVPKTPVALSAPLLKPLCSHAARGQPVKRPIVPLSSA